jgi:benzoyl-CoA reductase/2-hydroxyglutaryl-CoA dehydratase subunit BcrC/BadD/HgdB
MMQSFFRGLEDRILTRIRERSEIVSPHRVFGLELVRLGRRLADADNQVAWCGVYAPFEIINAMGVTSAFVEFLGGMLATAGMADSFLETAEHAGYSPDGCAYHRAVAGAALKEFLPPPGFFIATTCTCIAGMALLENLARIYKKDLFAIHIPCGQTVADVRYLADQIRGMTDFIARHTHKPLDTDALRQAIINTNQVREIMSDVFRMVQQVPSPANGRELGNLVVTSLMLLGTDMAITIAKSYQTEFKRRIRHNMSGVAGERLRLLWIQNRIQFRNPLIKILEEEYQTAVVVDELNNIYWDPIDPDNPYEGVARRMLSAPFNGSVNNRIDQLRKLAKEYRVDGVINPCHWGCRQGTGGRGLIERGLKEIGVPVLNLEVDAIDSRHFAEGQLRTRITAFVEMLEGRTSPWN